MPQAAPYIFHGADVSYFSGKVRPAFAQKNLWMREVMPDILEIKRRTGLHFFPVVETPDGEMWQDTSDILDRLETAHPDPPLIPATPVQRIVAYLIELYGDEMGILPAMHYRWSFEESIAKVSIDFSTPIGDEQGGAKFANRMKSTLPMLGIVPETVPAIEAHTHELLDHLSAHFRVRSTRRPSMSAPGSSARIARHATRRAGSKTTGLPRRLGPCCARWPTQSRWSSHRSRRPIPGRPKTPRPANPYQERPEFSNRPTETSRSRLPQGPTHCGCCNARSTPTETSTTRSGHRSTQRSPAQAGRRSSRSAHVTGSRSRTISSYGKVRSLPQVELAEAAEPDPQFALTETQVR